jgi:hypothetical protein
METRRGLQRFVVLFFIEPSARKVEIAGIASAASGLWMNQIDTEIAAARANHQALGNRIIQPEGVGVGDA